MNQAERLEKEYDWLGAVESYKKALNLLSEEDFSHRAEVTELLGYAFYRAAFQAENNNEFRERMDDAVASYEEVKELIRKTAVPLKTTRIFRSEAMIASINCCLTSEAPQKNRHLKDCWRMTKEALKTSKEAGNLTEYAKTYDQLASRAHQLCSLEPDPENREKITREAIEFGEYATTSLSSVNSSEQLARAYVRLASELTTLADGFILDMDEKDIFFQKGLDHWKKACELSGEAAFVELLDPSCGALDWNVDEIRTVYEKALDLARKTRDKRLIGTALDFLAYADFWRSMRTEDPDERAKIERRALQFAEDAKRSFSLVLFVSSRGGVLWTAAPYAEYFYEIARRETNLEKRRALLEQAVTNGTQATEMAESAGYLEIQMNENHVLSKSLVALAHLETKSDEKERLLEKALEYRKRSIVKVEQLTPSHYWNRGAMTNYLADLQDELASTIDPDKRRIMLEEAISNKKLSLQLCAKHASYFEKTGDVSVFAALGGYYYSYGEMLNHLYESTRNIEHQKEAIRAFKDAAEAYQKTNVFSRMAECHWKAARGHDVIGEHAKASKDFDAASEDYIHAAEKIPQLGEFYQDQSLYMQAWSEIEHARNSHFMQDYCLAREHYDKAALLHRSLQRWSCLASNYSAWANIEKAEELSRDGQGDEATLSFEEAGRQFEESKRSIQAVLFKIKDPDERSMVTSLIDTTDTRREYCGARIALEEAKTLDRKGEHYASAQKYGSAAETFGEIARTLELEHERREMECIAILSQAWQKMTPAEAEASPTLYEEASRLFEQAKDLSPNEKSRMLALGHSRFCRALEAGTRYADSREREMHATAVKYLQSASTYYAKAGFQEASEYAEATGKLFDAYVYMDNAKQEGDPGKKTRLFVITEKVLQSSAESYLKAKHLEKREHVLKMIDKVREEREFASSLSEDLCAHPAVMTTASFPITWQLHEKAVGLEKFEHAHIQADVRASKKELHPLEDIELEIELVNAGKGSALLIRIEEIIPEGFELTRKPEHCRIEQNSIIMKGKRLDPLKTENLKLVMRPKILGTFSLNPKIHYLTEESDHKTTELEKLTLRVKELGIKGWLKGER